MPRILLHPKRNRRSAVSVAKLQIRDIESVVRRSNTLASRIWRMAAQAARANKVRTGSQPRVRPFDSDLRNQVQDELVGLMAYSFLKRTKLSKRRRSLSKDIDLSLASSLEAEANKIADQFDLDLGKLKKRFEPFAKKSLNKSLGEIRDTMNVALARATQEGLPTQAATDFVLESLKEHGIVPRSSTYVETLVRTHAAVSYGAAHRVSFEGDVDVWGYELVTVGDDRVRESHAVMDGTIRKKDDPFWQTWWPPNGWNCRCQVIAIYDDEAKQTPIPSGDPDEGWDFDPIELVN